MGVVRRHAEACTWSGRGRLCRQNVGNEPFSLLPLAMPLSDPSRPLIRSHDRVTTSDFGESRPPSEIQKLLLSSGFRVERVTGIEPAYPAGKPGILAVERVDVRRVGPALRGQRGQEGGSIRALCVTFREVRKPLLKTWVCTWVCTRAPFSRPPGRFSAGHTPCDRRKRLQNTVEVGGVEPPSFSFAAGLLRAQPIGNLEPTAVIGTPGGLQPT